MVVDAKCRKLPGIAVVVAAVQAGVVVFGEDGTVWHHGKFAHQTDRGKLPGFAVVVGIEGPFRESSIQVLDQDTAAQGNRHISCAHGRLRPGSAVVGAAQHLLVGGDKHGAVGRKYDAVDGPAGCERVIFPDAPVQPAVGAAVYFIDLAGHGRGFPRKYMAVGGVVSQRIEAAHYRKYRGECLPEVGTAHNACAFCAEHGCTIEQQCCQKVVFDPKGTIPFHFYPVSAVIGGMQYLVAVKKPQVAVDTNVQGRLRVDRLRQRIPAPALPAVGAFMHANNGAVLQPFAVGAYGEGPEGKTAGRAGHTLPGKLGREVLCTKDADQ